MSKHIHFESSGQSTSLDSQETTAILQNAMNDRHIWLQAFVSDFAALLFAFSFSAAVLNDIKFRRRTAVVVLAIINSAASHCHSLFVRICLLFSHDNDFSYQ